MVFYLALNGNIPPLLNFFGAHGRVRDCANLVRLQKTLNPDWRFVINSGDSDLKIITDFVKQHTSSFPPEHPMVRTIIYMREQRMAQGTAGDVKEK
ncbi:hypothetical protein RB195_012954 [Necator americanus]|uniref:Phosphatidate phosphatase APP1 catalytic domain-containing protein n=1 Tax=Necator americanus TaxID=51031 RepID=A0ABR1DTA8_NECAM